MKNAAIWKSRGIRRELWDAADEAMAHMLQALNGLSIEVSSDVFAEALFQLHELPKRSDAFNAKYRWRMP